MQTPLFDQTAGLWEQDGSLHDIYFTDTRIEDWLSFVEAASQYSARYSFDGRPGQMPPIHQVLADHSGSHLLSFVVSGVTVNCHFFVTDEIELDVTPLDVSDGPRHEALLGFVARLSIAIGKPALITREDERHAPYLSFDPSRCTWTSGISQEALRK